MANLTSVTAIAATTEDELKMPYYDYIETDEANGWKTYRGFKYHAKFPEGWILDEKQGTGRDCPDCVGTCLENPGYAMWEGKIIGYCTKCAEEYEFRRGPGFIYYGEEKIIPDVPSVFDIYLEGMDTESLYDAKIYPENMMEIGELEQQKFICKNKLCNKYMTITPFHNCPECHHKYCKNGCTKEVLYGCVVCTDCFYDDMCKECNTDIDRENDQCPKCLKKCCRYCPDTELVDSSDFCKDCYEPDDEEYEYDESFIQDDFPYEDEDDDGDYCKVFYGEYVELENGDLARISELKFGDKLKRIPK